MAARTVRYSDRVVGAGGTLRTATLERSVYESASVVVTFDAEWSHAAGRYTTCDVVVSEGDDGLGELCIVSFGRKGSEPALCRSVSLACQITSNPCHWL